MAPPLLALFSVIWVPFRMAAARSRLSAPPNAFGARGVRCQVSGVRCQVSGVRCQVSGVRCQVSGIRCQV
jgi:hypothetical protein